MENRKERYDELIKLDFTTRESYFVWVRKWKAFYKELSQYIRDLNATIRIEQREMSLRMSEYLSSGVWPKEEVSDDYVPLWRFRARREDARNYATCALQLRADGKKESWAAKMRALEKVS